jgi:hypothetical protein
MSLEEDGTFENLKTPNMLFHYLNIIPIPNFLTKIFIELDDKDPVSVATAFFHAMYTYDIDQNTNTTEDNDNAPDLIDEHQDDRLKESMNETEETHKKYTVSPSTISDHGFLAKFIHVIQFCLLCAAKRILPVLYTIAIDQEALLWFNSILLKHGLVTKNSGKLYQRTLSNESDDDDENEDSSSHKASRTDQHLLNTFLKINDAMDQKIFRQNQVQEEKEPGFARLEHYHKNMILNTSALPPFKTPATAPTEFYLALMVKKSQFKAKETLLHRLNMDKISFNPSASFVANLWNCDFFWILPDTPSGISIFFCPESKSINAQVLEKERSFALADKVKNADIEKLSKQKLYIPNTLMDMIWMTQNMYAIISLCFGEKSHSATFLSDWAKHMYNNRIVYSSLQSSDHCFFPKVLFAIDSAPQIHWRSCCDASDRMSVNNKVLLSQDLQDSILHHNFHQLLPKIHQQ